jgi:tRNA A37 threonylcarbamoyladenosine biosynthesis protein TsaE
LIEWAEKAGKHMKILNYKVNITTDDNEEDVREIIIEQVESHMF